MKYPIDRKSHIQPLMTVLRVLGDSWTAGGPNSIFYHKMTYQRRFIMSQLVSEPRLRNYLLHYVERGKY